MHSIKASSRFTLICLVLLGLSLSSASAATLNIDGGGNLLGASGVDVGGTIYDVEFLDGSCVDIFDGCAAVSDFDFTTEADAMLASAALMAVILDTVDGDFDSQPDLTNGCTHPFHCNILTPYAFASGLALTAGFLNSILESGDSAPILLTLNNNNANEVNVSFASWNVSPVPVPAAVWLFGTALVGFIGFSKRKSKAAV